MAKRTTKKGKATKKKSVGAMPKMDLTGWLLIIGGAVVANKITAWATKADSKMGEFAPYMALAVGIGLPMFVKNPMVQKASLGLIAGGGVEALKKVAPKLISGVNGPYQLQVVGKAKKLAGNAMNPNAIGITPMRNSAMSAMQVISGMPMNNNGNGGAGY